MKQSFIRVLGSADWHQTAYNDHSCYTICDKILIDACPSVITQLLEHDVDPLGIRTVCFTHMHCDHYMGLAPLLHYWRVCRDRDLGELTIVGPKATVRKFVMKAMDFLFDTHINECVTVMPRIIEVGGGDTVDIPGFHIDVLDGDHPTPDVC
ncbi:MAG: MBL fold metallo-hydrolase, partial [Eubacteriales bacterium]|nr:MBL fold metallo-hydrolase [Eubacteriales bacterium]